MSQHIHYTLGLLYLVAENECEPEKCGIPCVCLMSCMWCCQLLWDRMNIRASKSSLEYKMHAECRYIWKCSCHPCLPVEMFRNYKMICSQIKKTTFVKSEKLRIKLKSVSKVNTKPVFIYFQRIYVQTMVLGSVFSTMTPGRVRLPVE